MMDSRKFPKGILSLKKQTKKKLKNKTKPKRLNGFYLTDKSKPRQELNSLYKHVFS